MTVASVEMLHGLKLGSTFYSQLENGDPTFNDDRFAVIASGDTIPRFISLNGSKEDVPFGTHQLASAITQFGLFGTGSTNADIFFRKVLAKGTRTAAATAEHTKFRSASWFAYLMSLSAGHRQQAVARGRMVALYDGTNSPLVRSSVAITDTPSTSENFVLGPISHNGTVISSCDGFTLDFQPNIIELADRSDPGTTFVAVNNIAPVITFTTTELGIESLRGAAITNSFKVNLLRRKPDDRLYADVDLQHILITVSNGMFFVSGVAGSPAAKQVTVVCRGTDASGFTGVPLAMAVSSAVSTSA